MHYPSRRACAADGATTSSTDDGGLRSGGGYAAKLLPDATPTFPNVGLVASLWGHLRDHDRPG